MYIEFWLIPALEFLPNISLGSPRRTARLQSMDSEAGLFSGSFLRYVFLRPRSCGATGFIGWMGKAIVSVYLDVHLEAYSFRLPTSIFLPATLKISLPMRPIWETHADGGAMGILSPIRVQVYIPLKFAYASETGYVSLLLSKHNE
ncbi:hypothetical protein C8R47DRAFT_1068176 [Mycena vitilis]|nr:hypothetical protein C8R47DRAFT_1068176 [Mycena vitilis]